MNALKLDVAQDTNVPLFMHRALHPFGKPLGTIDTSFTNFDPTFPSAEYFDIPGFAKCQEGEDQQCDDLRNRLR